MNIGQKYQIYKDAIAAMQGHTFYCEDANGVLRRWTPPALCDDDAKPNSK